MIDIHFYVILRRTALAFFLGKYIFEIGQVK
jgi:hypothetical protein